MAHLRHTTQAPSASAAAHDEHRVLGDALLMLPTELAARILALTGLHPWSTSSQPQLSCIFRCIFADLDNTVTWLKQRYGQHPALMRAARRDQARVVSALLAEIEDGRTRAERAGWALLVAATHGHEAIVRLLLEAGANLRCCRDAQPLIAAAEQGHLGAVQQLIAAGSDVNAADGSALRVAAANNHTSVAAALLRAGADVNAGHSWALFASAASGHTDMVRRLISAGAQGLDEALVFAASKGHQEVVSLLVQAGANATILQA